MSFRFPNGLSGVCHLKSGPGILKAQKFRALSPANCTRKAAAVLVEKIGGAGVETLETATIYSIVKTPYLSRFIDEVAIPVPSKPCPAKTVVPEQPLEGCSSLNYASN